jgi:hypothetical protein
VKRVFFLLNAAFAVAILALRSILILSYLVPSCLPNRSSFQVSEATFCVHFSYDITVHYRAHTGLYVSSHLIFFLSINVIMIREGSKSPPLVPILSHINPIHTIPSYLRSSFNIVHPPTSWSSGFPSNILYAFLFSPNCATCPAHLKIFS